MNKKITSNITASARLIYQLGEQLISDEIVALMELIKNGYDADATNIEIEVDTKLNTEYAQGKITIWDNGNGMLPSLIQGAFLRLSTNYKEVEKVSMFFKRRVLGKKGIGRLSFQRLGRYVRVTTTPRVDRYFDYDNLLERNEETLVTGEDRQILQDFDTFIIDIDWANFTVDQDLQDISADVTSIKSDRKVYGTKIEILGIRNLSFWDLDKNKINRLKREIFGMINPFVNNSVEKFNINLSIDGVKYSNDSISENVLEKSCDIIVDFSFENWILKINVDRKKKYWIREKNKKVDKMNGNGFQLSEQKDYPEKKIQYVLDINNREKMNKEYPYLRKVNMDLVNIGKSEERIMAYPGKFEGRIYASDFSPESKQYVRNLIEEKVFVNNGIRLYQELDKIWETANGLYVFRNKFRILPYGADEWAGFTAKSQTYKNVIYKANTIAGYITIDGESSENLEEQTNRLGLVEDEFGNNFMKLIKNMLVEIIVREDAKFREGFLDDNVEKGYIVTKNKLLLFKKTETEGEKKQELFKTIEDVVSINTEHNFNDLKDTAKETFKYIGKQIDNLKSIDRNIEIAHRQEKYEKEVQLEEVKDILPMVGQGIIVESLTHELKRIDENITTYAQKTIEEILKDIISKTIIKEYQNNIIQETIYLKEQLKHIEPTYKKNVEKIEKINIKNFLEELYVVGGPMVNKANKRGVHVVVTGEYFSISANKGYLITIFDNLFLNSLYWLDFDEIVKKNIYFNIKSTGVVEYWDSGFGIHPDIEDDLFRPFKTLKQDGRGLGLYIVQELMSLLNGEIILTDRRRNERKYKFELRFYEL